MAAMLSSSRPPGGDRSNANATLADSGAFHETIALQIRHPARNVMTEAGARRAGCRAFPWRGLCPHDANTSGGSRILGFMGDS
jgi:hypothetical protein